MPLPSDRRQFLATTALGGLGLLGRLPAVSADDATLDPKVVRLDPGIEPLVKLLEDTPRDRLLEEVAGRIKKGLSYREVLAALFLAGVRNVEPRPSVGFKFHAVLVVNSAHLASLAAPDQERWLPIFWALDNFKSAQATNVKERGGWRMPPVKESASHPPARPGSGFVDALEKWDTEAADVAVAGLVRTAGADEVYDVLWKYAPRDSGRSGTRSSSPPTPAGPWGRSAGRNTPSRSSGRSSTPSWPTKTRRPARTTRPTASAA